MSVRRDNEAKVLSVSQKAYLENVLQWFGMYDCKPVTTLMEPGKKYDKLEMIKILLAYKDIKLL